MRSQVSDVMTHNVVAVRQIAEFKDMVEVMRRRRVSAFPVIDADDRVIGVVSEADLLGVYDRPDEQICEEITEQVIAQNFAFGPNEFTVTVSRGVATIAGRVEPEEVALSLLQAVWDVEGVVDVRDRLSYPNRHPGPDSRVPKVPGSQAQRH